MQNQTHNLDGDLAELRAELVAENHKARERTRQQTMHTIRGMRSDDLIAEMRMRGILAERKRLQRQIKELEQIGKAIDAEGLFLLIDREDTKRRREAVIQAIEVTKDAIARNAMAMKSPVTSPIAFLEAPTAFLETESRVRKQARDRQRMAQLRAAMPST